MLNSTVEIFKMLAFSHRCVSGPIFCFLYLVEWVFCLILGVQVIPFSMLNAYHMALKPVRVQEGLLARDKLLIKMNDWITLICIFCHFFIVKNSLNSISKKKNQQLNSLWTLDFSLVWHISGHLNIDKNKKQWKAYLVNEGNEFSSWK